VKDLVINFILERSTYEKAYLQSQSDVRLLGLYNEIRDAMMRCKA
jgi:hypothetical protein